MKRGLLLVTFLLLAPSLVPAQETVTNPAAGSAGPPPASQPGQTALEASAAARAAQEAADERYQRMAADIQSLQAANDDLANRISSLEDQLRKLHDAVAAQANNSSVQDDIKRLGDRIDEIDRKREEDKAAISNQVRSSIEDLEKALAQSTMAPQPVPRERDHPEHSPLPKTEENATPPPDAANGFVYTVKQGDNLSLIVKAYNADFKSKGMKTITLRQAREANPKVDWNRLLVGQKIIIPRPLE